MNFNSVEFKKFRKDLSLALAPLEKEYGIRILQGQISYTEDSFSIKLEAEKTIGKDGKAIDPEQKTFERWCESYGLKPEDYKAHCSVMGSPGTYIITGINPRASKNAIKIARESDGKAYVCQRSLIVLQRDEASSK